ncbi:MAG: hypothetical protein KGP28_08300, partial [Bdellovibrionales bacterium]|nr:hypothetical protein [Bdellovibrionales bacterium]
MNRTDFTIPLITEEKFALKPRDVIEVAAFQSVLTKAIFLFGIAFVSSVATWALLIPRLGERVIPWPFSLIALGGPIVAYVVVRKVNANVSLAKWLAPVLGAFMGGFCGMFM